jgi:hypothetical protein
MSIDDVTCGENGSLGSELVTIINQIKNLAESLHQVYWFYSNDTLTNPANGGSKIVHGAGSNTTFLTNNAAGSRTYSYNPKAKNDIWNPSTNAFDLTSLKLGDIVKLRVDLVVDHAAAQEINLVMDLAEGSIKPYTLNVSHDYYVTATNNVTLTAFFEFPISTQETIDYSARLRFKSVAAATIVVEGWYYQILEVE